jgi:ATP-dependent Clp protease ATP-binding subunit ClpC
MSLSVTIPVYQRRSGQRVELVTLGLGNATRTRSATSLAKAEEQLIDDLRRVVESTPPRHLPRFELKRGTRLERVHVELALRDGNKKRKVSGTLPLVVEPRLAGPGRTFSICYHPMRQSEWFPVTVGETLREQAIAYFSHAWADLPGDDPLGTLWTLGRDGIQVVSFSVRAKSLLDELPRRKKGIWDDLSSDPVRDAQKKQPGAMKVLPSLSVDLTARQAGNRNADLGMTRSPYREQLNVLLAGPHKRSTLVVGGRGSGKSTLIEQLTADLLAAEDHASHRNLDKVTHVHRLSGKQIIAGMSHVGDWEQRCVDLLEDVRGRKIILLISDLHLFGRIGRARDSERSLADFFRAPLARGEVAIIAECTDDELRRLEEDAPSFAPLFVRVHVKAASSKETFRMMLARGRKLETAHRVRFDPYAYKTILELGSSLFPAEELPGKAVNLTKRIAKACEGSAAGPTQIGSALVIEHLSQRTGLPWVLLSSDNRLPAEEVETALSARVLGQAGAVREMADLVVRIKAGLTDPSRPFGVYLFTGPTGTGKTELAKALAEYLYGSASRLLRFDMSELRTPDAPARLIGDAWNPEGLLTRAGQEQPFSVLLLDEIEKAHPSVLNLLLQLFDEGRLTDAAGNTASFKQSVIIMTSNLGAKPRRAAGFGEAADAVMLDVARAVREFFPPELFNRIDAVVPFAPLDRTVAISVAEKELSKLLGRAGLRDRNIFVQATTAVVERVAREAFQSRDGARSLKRFLEDRIGSLLSAELARTPGASMQVMRVYDAGGELRVHHEALVEAKQVAIRFALEPILRKPREELQRMLPELLARFERIERSEQLATLSEQLREHLSEQLRGQREHGELLYNLDWMRLTLRRYRERVEQLATDTREYELDEIERSFDEPEMRGRYAIPSRGSRWELFTCFAEAHVLERALARVQEPQEHAVFIEIMPVGSGRLLFEWMLMALSRARGTLDGVCTLTKEGRIDEGHAVVYSVPSAQKELVVLKVVGLSVKDFFELETGTHVWHPVAREPELIRVRVFPANHGDSPRPLVERYVAAKAAFDREGADPTLNPAQLLPIVRRAHFEPPPPRKAATRLELEDYVLGISEVWRARALSQALAPIWLLRLSRQTEEAS